MNDPQDKPNGIVQAMFVRHQIEAAKAEASPAPQATPQAGRDVIILRINPVTRNVAAMRLPWKKDFLGEVRRILRSKTVGHFTLPPAEQDGDQIPVVVACGLDSTESGPGFRFRGSDNEVVGLGLVFGQGPGGGLVSAPVDAAWVQRMISWVVCEYRDPHA